MSPSTLLEEITAPETPYEVSFPKVTGEVDQDEEWFEFRQGGRVRRLGMHDYGAIYDTPGLYESLVYRALECRSPVRVVRPLEQRLEEEGRSLGDLRVLDLGAGNGIVGELLQRRGARELLGVDILPEAERAAERDRPGVYDDYVVTDLTEPGPDAERRLERFAPDALVTVAALGFGDIPPEAFLYAFDLLPEGGWVAVCIKDRFLEEDDESGFGRLLRSMVSDGTVRVHHRERYVHRLSIQREKLHYVALIGQKVRDAGPRA